MYVYRSTSKYVLCGFVHAPHLPPITKKSLNPDGHFQGILYNRRIWTEKNMSCSGSNPLLPIR
jgi:hypothetical protein